MTLRGTIGPVVAEEPIAGPSVNVGLVVGLGAVLLGLLALRGRKRNR